jgi:1-deoxy-D-xylulose-5-phosphate reductoisomerase
VRRRISILGATGSVGQSTLDLVKRSPDRFEVVALTAQTKVRELADAALATGARLAAVADEACLPQLRSLLEGSGCRAAAGPEALIEAASGEADWVMAAIVGCSGLVPTMAAVEAGKTVALANKEALITAGQLMIGAAARSGATLVPVDSEHNAIFQCLAGSRKEDVSRLILTASGGPFRTASAQELAIATPAQAVSHPKWSMGAKISVDSATLMNKGLELIEAHHLFGLGSKQIEVVIHPQSTVHSLVEFVDGSLLAQLGTADMRIPIAYALSWPQRMETPAARLDLVELGRLDFEAPDLERFPALRLAREALESQGGAAIILNAANEVAVELFLAARISFPEIASMVAEALNRTTAPAPQSIDEVIALDSVTRAKVRAAARESCS